MNKIKADTLTSLREAAQSGDLEAQFRLGRAYAERSIVAADDAEAAKWLERAALRGHTDAAVLLSGLIGAGRLPERSAYEARMWLRIAAEEGNTSVEVAVWRTPMNRSRSPSTT